MEIRQRTEQWEKEKLSDYATLAADSKGRKRSEELCPIRTCFQRDRDRIIHCKAFRRHRCFCRRRATITAPD